MEAATVVHEPRDGRFAIYRGGHVAELVYRDAKGAIEFVHTGVPVELEGQGLARTLAEAGLTYARDHGLTVRPYCPYVRGYILKHPEWRDLVDPGFDMGDGARRA